MPILITQITFKEISNLSKIPINSVSRIIDQLVELGIVVKDTTVMKKGYRYQSIYEVFVGNKDYM